MQMTKEFAEKHGYKKLSRTKHWYALPGVLGNFWAKLGVSNPQTLCIEELPHCGDYVVYTYSSLRKKPRRAAKSLTTKTTFSGAKRFAESWMRSHD